MAAWERWCRPAGPLHAACEALLPLVEWNLRRLKRAPPRTNDDAGPLATAWVAAGLLADVAVPLLAALGADGVHALVLKGFALAHSVYPSPALRPMRDLDLLVGDAGFGPAEAALTRLGFRQAATQPRSRLAHLHGIAFVGPAPFEIDLHRQALVEASAPGIDDGFLARAVPLSLPGVDVRTLYPADQLLLVCVHGQRWSPEPPLRWVADATMLVRHAVVDWDVLLSEARQRDLCLPLERALRLLRNTVEAPIPATLLASLRREGSGWRRRLEAAARRRPPALGRGLFLHWCGLRREQPSSPWVRRVLAFPRYLAELWGLSGPWAVPSAALVKSGLRLLRRHS